MKKCFLSVLLLLSTIIISNAQSQVGDGTIRSFYPIDVRYHYSYSQVIYLGSEINASGSIISIQWYYDGDTPTPSNQITDLYIGHTSKNTFATVKDWEPITNLTKVYTGRFNNDGGKGWKKITLTTPFVYDGSSNLVIATNTSNNTLNPGSGNLNTTDRFINTAFSGNRSLISQTNNKSYDMSAPPGFSIASSNAPNIIFDGLVQTCETPKGLKASNITTNSATISWDIPKYTPSNGTEYYISTSSLPPDYNEIPNGTVTSGQTANTIALNSATYYYVWVRNNCGNGNYSAWSVGIKFITLCEPTTGFFENCEGETINIATYWTIPKCWSGMIRNSKGLGQFPASISISGSSLVHDEKSIAISNGDENTANTDVILISPILATIPLENYRVKFWARSTKNATLQIGTISSTNPDTAVFSQINQVKLETGVTEYTFNLTGYNGSDKYVAFRLASPEINSNLFIDDILLEPIPTCPDVDNIKVISTTINSASIIWEDKFNTGKYQVAYGLETATDPDNATQLNQTTTLSATISGLSPNTKYKVWVRSICDGTRNGVWIGPIRFLTPCDAIASLHENFDEVSIPDIPNCWGKILRGGASVDFGYIKTVKDAAYQSFPNSVLINPGGVFNASLDVILFTPQLESSTLTDGKHRLVFYAKKNYEEGTTILEIGTLNNNTNAAVFLSFQEIQLTSTMTKYVVEFTNYSGSDSIIGFRIGAIEDNNLIIIDDVTWEEIPQCMEVTQVEVSNITTNSATINWTQLGDESSWELVYSPDSKINPDDLDLNAANTNSTFLIKNLLANTKYTVWVRATCDFENKSTWSDSINFTTKCSPIESFNEKFESSITPNLPDCWSKILRGETLSNSAYVKTYKSNVDNVSTYSAIISNGNSGEDDDIILVSPNLSTLVLGTYRLRIIGQGDTNNQIDIGTLSNNDNDAQFNLIKTIITDINPKEYIIDFSGYSGSDTYIGIRTANYGDNWFKMYTIIWEKTPACPDTKNIKNIITTTNNASFSWDINDASNWQVTLGLKNDNNPDNLNIIDVNLPYIEFNDLTSNTNYKLWIRSVCDTNKYGKWSDALNFTTQCIATNVPYVQDFETSNSPNMPECTSAISPGVSTHKWITANNPGYGFTSNTMQYIQDNVNPADAWFFTQGINLESGKNYKLSFRYGGGSTNEYFVNDLKVMYGKSATVFDMNIQLADYQKFLSASPINETISFSPPTTDVYYFGFNAYSQRNKLFIFVDDIKIDLSLSNSQFDLSQLNYYPNPIKDVLNISFVDHITSVSVYNLLGQEVIAKSINGNLSQINMTNLSNGTYLVKVTSSQLSKIIKVVKE